MQVSSGAGDSDRSLVATELYEAWRQLRRGTVRKLVAATYEGGGIPLEPSQADIVEFVAQSSTGDDGVRMVDIANAMNIAQPTATRVVGRLIDRGLLERQKSRDDARAVIIRTTERGREECERFRTMQHMLLDAVLADFSVDEIADGARFLERLLEGIDRAAAQITGERPSE